MALLNDIFFDNQLNTFEQVGSLATIRSNHGATLMSDGRVIVAGGTDSLYMVLLGLFA